MRGLPVMSASISFHVPVATTRLRGALDRQVALDRERAVAARLTVAESKRISGWRSASKNSGLWRWP